MNEPESVSHSYELLSSTLGRGTANAWDADPHFRGCLQCKNKVHQDLRNFEIRRNIQDLKSTQNINKTIVLEFGDHTKNITHQYNHFARPVLCWETSYCLVYNSWPEI